MSTSTFRMSKDLANKVALSLLEGKFKEVSKLKGMLSEYITAIAESKVPEAVMNLSKHYHEYLETSSTAYLNEKGFNRLTVSFTRPIPHPSAGYVNLELTDLQAQHALKLHNTKEAKIEKNKRIYEDVKSALLNLKTYAKIEQAFPEAAQYLPKQGCVALQVDLVKLRKEIAP